MKKLLNNILGLALVLGLFTAANLPQRAQAQTSVAQNATIVLQWNQNDAMRAGTTNDIALHSQNRFFIRRIVGQTNIVEYSDVVSGVSAPGCAFNVTMVRTDPTAGLDFLANAINTNSSCASLAMTASRNSFRDNTNTVRHHLVLTVNEAGSAGNGIGLLMRFEQGIRFAGTPANVSTFFTSVLGSGEFANDSAGQTGIGTGRGIGATRVNFVGGTDATATNPNIAANASVVLRFNPTFGAVSANNYRIVIDDDMQNNPNSDTTQVNADIVLRGAGGEIGGADSAFHTLITAVNSGTLPIRASRSGNNVVLTRTEVGAAGNMGDYYIRIGEIPGITNGGGYRDSAGNQASLTPSDLFQVLNSMGNFVGLPIVGTANGQITFSGGQDQTDVRDASSPLNRIVLGYINPATDFTLVLSDADGTTSRVEIPVAVSQARNLNAGDAAAIAQSIVRQEELAIGTIINGINTNSDTLGISALRSGDNIVLFTTNAARYRNGVRFAVRGGSSSNSLDDMFLLLSHGGSFAGGSSTVGFAAGQSNMHVNFGGVDPIIPTQTTVLGVTHSAVMADGTEIANAGSGTAAAPYNVGTIAANAYEYVIHFNRGDADLGTNGFVFADGERVGQNWVWSTARYSVSLICPSGCEADLGENVEVSFADNIADVFPATHQIDTLTVRISPANAISGEGVFVLGDVTNPVFRGYNGSVNNVPIDLRRFAFTSDGSAYSGNISQAVSLTPIDTTINDVILQGAKQYLASMPKLANRLNRSEGKGVVTGRKFTANNDSMTFGIEHSNYGFDYSKNQFETNIDFKGVYALKGLKGIDWGNWQGFASQFNDFEFWADVSYTAGENDSGENENEAFYGHFGADVSVHEDVVVGVMLSIDQTTFTSNGNDVDTLGWMVGPYAVGSLQQHDLPLDLEARISYGQSTLEQPGGEETDTERLLASGAVSHQLEQEIEGYDILFTPRVGFSYFSDEADEQPEAVELSRVDLSIKAATDIEMQGAMFTPSLTLVGFFDSVSGVEMDDSTTTGRIEAQVNFNGYSGVDLFVGGHYDVIVDDADLQTYGITGGVNIKF